MSPGVPLTITAATLDGAAVGVRCVDGLIAAIGPRVWAEDGDEVIDAGGAVLCPSLVNGHTHAAMTLFRGYGDDIPLMRWLEEKIWPVEARLEADDVYWGTRLACAEMIRTGTTRFWDMYWQHDATAQAVTDAGLRATIGAPLIDQGTNSAKLRQDAVSSLDHLEAAGDAITPSLAPHAIYTVSEESLRFIAELGAERRVPVQIHLSETEGEVTECVARHGMRPAHYLDGLGMLGENTLLAHGVWLDDSELELIAERGATVISNPVANLKLAVGGVFPYPAANRAGVAIGLGTDGPGSNNSLDLLADVKVFALLQKHNSADASAIDASAAWQVATGRRAPLLGTGEPLTVGAPADFILLRPGALEVSLGDLTSALVYTASGSVVDTTVVAGRVLMRGGTIDGLDEIVARTCERAERLGLG